MADINAMYNADENTEFGFMDDDLSFESGVDLIGDAFDKMSLSFEQIENMLTFESALALEEDPSRIRDLLVANYGDESLTVESAIEAKDTILGKIGTIVDWAVSNIEENSTFILDVIKNRIGDSTKDLERLKERVMMSEANPAPVSSLRNKLTNSYLGMFTGMALNINSSSDVIKFINMPKDVLLPLFKENAKFVDSFKNLNTRTIANNIALDVLKKSDKSISFIKSLKNVKLKNLDFVAGYPTKLTSINCSFVTASLNEGKYQMVVDTNSVKMPIQYIKRASRADAVKILDAAINMVKGNQAIYKEVKDLLYSISLFTGWLRGVAGTGGVANPLDPKRLAQLKGLGAIAVFINKGARFNTHYMVATKNLAKSNHDMKNFVKSYIQTAYIS